VKHCVDTLTIFSFLFAMALNMVGSPFCATAHASDLPESFYKITRRDLVFGIFMDNAGVGIAVGNKGLILRTHNSGSDWLKIDSNTFYSLNDVTFKGTTAWIVGQRGAIYHSMDNGQSWTSQTSNTESSLMRVFFIDDRKGFIVGETGAILKTENGGDSWKIKELDWFSIMPESLIEIGVIAPNLYDVYFINDDIGWIVGDYGIVLTTEDGGENWNLRRGGQFPMLFGVYFADNNNGWAVGQNGLLLNSSDGGRSWETVTVPTNVSLHKIYLSGLQGIIIGDQSTILETFNGGKDWTLLDLHIPPPYPWFGDFVMLRESSQSELIVVGKGLISKIPISVNLKQ